MYKKILVPIDLAQTEKADAMVKAAHDYRTQGGEIIMATVVPDFPPYVVSGLPAGYIEDQLPGAKAELREIATSAGVSSANTFVRAGHPANLILSIAESEGCDLIIIGSHRPGLKDYFLGSTASRVVGHATCSVLVMR
ncbi:MAG: universal stress protein [Pseudomonadota bacterium]